MPTSQYFNNYNSQYTEQRLVEDLIVESIKIMGFDGMYLTNDNDQARDLLYGEDPVKKFTSAFPVEMYLSEALNFTGDKEFFSKFGLEIQETARMCVARRSYEKTVMKYLTDGLNHHVPKEGDLVYLPIQYKLMEIKFVEDEKNFFQLGRDSVNPYMYGLSMEAFKYNGELIQTGIDEIDRVANKQAVSVEHILSVGGTGIYEQYEWVYQGASLATATAKAVVAGWDNPTRKLKLRNIMGQFSAGNIIGQTSGAIWTFSSANTMRNASEVSIDDNYRIESDSQDFLDFTEHNPFGEPNETL